MPSVTCPHCGKVNVVQMTKSTVSASCRVCGKALYNRGDNTTNTPALDDRIGNPVYFTEAQHTKLNKLLTSLDPALTEPT
jgi:hypothetical protein